MKEATHAEQLTISDKSNIRVPIGLVVSVVVSLSIAFYFKTESDNARLTSALEKHKEEQYRKFESMSLLIGQKANREDAADRYTASDAREDFDASKERLSAHEQRTDERFDAHESAEIERFERIDERFESLRRENEVSHKSLQRQLDYLNNKGNKQ